MNRKILLPARYLLIILCFISIVKIIITIIDPQFFFKGDVFSNKPEIYNILEYMQMISIYGGLALVYFTWDNKKPVIRFLILGASLILLANFGYIINYFKLIVVLNNNNLLVFSCIQVVLTLLIAVILISLKRLKGKSIPLIGYVIYYSVSAISSLIMLIVINSVDIFTADLSVFNIIGSWIGNVIVFILLILLIVDCMLELRRMDEFTIFAKAKALVKDGFTSKL